MMHDDGSLATAAAPMRSSRANVIRMIAVAALVSIAATAPIAGPAASSPAASEFSLSRHGCYGACPSDTVTIEATGAVEYNGYSHTAKLGRYRGHIDAKTYARILAMAARAKFFTLSAVFGVHPDEAATYDISARRRDGSFRIDVNDPTVAPRPLRDLAGLLSQIRDATPLTSDSRINTVVGDFYATPSPDQELYVGIGATDDTVFGDRGYIIAIRRRIAQPCNAGQPKTDELPAAAVELDSGGAITGAGYSIVATAKGIRISNAHETVDLARAPYANAPDLQLVAVPSARCPTTIEITRLGDVTDATPFFDIDSNVDLNVPSVVARAHFQCDSARGVSIPVVTSDFPPKVGHPEIDLAPARALFPNTPCRLLIDAGATPKGLGQPAAAAQSTDFYYVPPAR